MNTDTVCSPAAFAARWMAVTIMAVVTLLPALPVMAYEAPPTGAEYLAQHRPPALESEHDGAIWSLALIGPAAILLIVTVLGLTITIGSLRADLRRQFELDRYWPRGAGARAARVVRRETLSLPPLQ